MGGLQLQYKRRGIDSGQFGIDGFPLEASWGGFWGGDGAQSQSSEWWDRLKQNLR